MSYPFSAKTTKIDFIEVLFILGDKVLIQVLF